MSRRAPVSAATLHGRLLLLARATWVAITVATLGAFVAAVPVRYARLAHPTEGVRAALAEVGISPGGYALYTVGLDAIFVSVFAAVATLHSASRPSGWCSAWPLRWPAPLRPYTPWRRL